MNPMELHLTLYIDNPVPIEDLDDLATLVREAVNEKIGEVDYLVQDVIGFDISYEFID